MSKVENIPKWDNFAIEEVMKPCPYCGEEKCVQPVVYGIRSDEYWFVSCVCGARGPQARTREDAILLWNAAANQIEQLKRERDEARRWAREYKRRLIAAAKAMRGEG